MNAARRILRGTLSFAACTPFFALSLVCGSAQAPQQDTQAPQQDNRNVDGKIVGEAENPELPRAATPAQRQEQAWKMLSDAVNGAKGTQMRIQGLAAVGMLCSPRAEKLIEEAMKDPDVDIRTAAVLAAGQTKDRNLTTPMRNLLDDKEPQVVFTAATTLWKMGDRSGEDILMSVADGDRSTHPGLMQGTEHKISRDLHDPAKLAKLGAIQGAYMLLGPFGYGLTAFQFIHQSGGNAARVSAIQQLSEERTEPVHKELLDALDDKDASVREAALKGLVDYRDKATSTQVYQLLEDTKDPVRLTAAAAYLRTTGTPGPTEETLRPVSRRARKLRAR